MAIYRDMWHIDDPDQPIGQRPPGRSGRQEQHWCNLDARITGQGSGVVNPGKTRKTTRNRPENPKPRVETPNPQPWRKGTRNGRHGRNIIEQLARWADAMTRTLAAWDTGTLIVLAVTLTVLAGVTGRATTGGGLIRQILWITVTAILTSSPSRPSGPSRADTCPSPSSKRSCETSPATSPLPEPGHGGTHTTMVTMGKRDTME
ncbi:hypothetical protein [Bifidobacterium longum]|uniref:hypothetical protein n=1 Tax=Bifidobacterium longum TaxID=216816 RepID=UPI001F613FC5|nr:hypothetical protein [Bifidobacterium longum]